jgi:hypothetical protein
MIRYKTDFDKFVVVGNLKRRGWEEVESVLDDDWWVPACPPVCPLAPGVPGMLHAERACMMTAWRHLPGHASAMHGPSMGDTRIGTSPRL